MKFASSKFCTWAIGRNFGIAHCMVVSAKLHSTYGLLSDSETIVYMKPVGLRRHSVCVCEWVIFFYFCVTSIHSASFDSNWLMVMTTYLTFLSFARLFKTGVFFSSWVRMWPYGSVMVLPVPRTHSFVMSEALITYIQQSPHLKISLFAISGILWFCFSAVSAQLSAWWSAASQTRTLIEPQSNRLFGLVCFLDERGWIKLSYD